MKKKTLMGNKRPITRESQARLDGIIAIKGMTTVIFKGGQRPLLSVLCGNSTRMRQLLPRWDGGDGPCSRDGLILSAFLDS